MVPVIASLLIQTIGPAVVEPLARNGMRALQLRWRQEPALAPATSAEIVAAVNHYNASSECAWTRERLFEFIAFFVSTNPAEEMGWTETPEQIADYVLRGPRPAGSPVADRAEIAAALVAEMETVRELMVRYLQLITEAATTAPVVELASQIVAHAAAETGTVPALEFGAGSDRPSFKVLLAGVKTLAGTALTQARRRTRRVNGTLRQANEARKDRALVAYSLKLLHTGGIGLAQAEACLLRKGYAAEVVNAVVADRIRSCQPEVRRLQRPDTCCDAAAEAAEREGSCDRPTRFVFLPLAGALRGR